LPHAHTRPLHLWLLSASRRRRFRHTGLQRGARSAARQRPTLLATLRRLMAYTSCLHAVERLAQFHLGLIQETAALGRQSGAAPIEVKREHRHRRAVGFRLAPLAGFGGALEREGDLARAALGEYTGLQVKRVAVARHAARPTARGRRSPMTRGLRSPMTRGLRSPMTRGLRSPTTRGCRSTDTRGCRSTDTRGRPSPLAGRSRASW